MHQKGIIYAPDFIINAGGLIHVAGPVMNQTEQQNLEKVDNIYNVLLNVFRDSVQNNIDTNKIAYNMALERLQED